MSAKEVLLLHEIEKLVEFIDRVRVLNGVYDAPLTFTALVYRCIGCVCYCTVYSIAVTNNAGLCTLRGVSLQAGFASIFPQLLTRVVKSISCDFAMISQRALQFWKSADFLSR